MNQETMRMAVSPPQGFKTLTSRGETMMKKLFWNVHIELCKDGTVRAAVIRTRKTVAIPRAAYACNPRFGCLEHLV
jgi:hypothetical protein